MSQQVYFLILFIFIITLYCSSIINTQDNNCNNDKGKLESKIIELENTITQLKSQGKEFEQSCEENTSIPKIKPKLINNCFTGSKVGNYFTVDEVNNFNKTCTIVFRPDENNGKDAYINSFQRYSDSEYGDIYTDDTNYGKDTMMRVMALTWGNIMKSRSLLQFDLPKTMPVENIHKAYLSIYWNGYDKSGHNRLHGEGGKQQYINSDVIVKRVLKEWSEKMVTWNNQPKTTEENSVIIPAPKNDKDDFLNIDVTNLVKDMLLYENNGFMLQLKNEVPYQILYYATSENGNLEHRPKLEITYSIEDLSKQAPLDLTPRIAMVQGNINQHTEKGVWKTDPDGRGNGAEWDKLEYCKKFYPKTVSVKEHKKETISGFQNAFFDEFTHFVMTYECIQP